MAQVADYSAGKPGALALAHAGFIGAVRYIGFPDRKKCTDRAELEDFSRNGLGMALVYEDNTNDWRGGEPRGIAAGQRGRDHANAIGFPADRPIYMAVDQDVVTAGEFNLMLNYLHGAAKTLGGAHATGVYGEADVIDRARDAGVASWFWQTAAWSRGRRTTAHLFQRVGTVNVGGIGCDINDVLSPDWGQHNAEVDMLTQKEVEQAVWNVLTSRFGPEEANRNLIDMTLQTLRNTFASNELLGKVIEIVTNDPDVTAAQVKQIIDEGLANLPPVHVDVDFSSLSDGDLSRFSGAVNDEADRRERARLEVNP